MNISFEQDRMFSRETFVLEDRQIIIRGEPGIEGERAIWLRDIAPQVSVIEKRFWRFYVIAAILAALMIGGSHYISYHIIPDSWFFTDVVSLISIYFAVSKNLKPIAVYQIRAKNGVLVAQLYASKSKRFKCVDFIQAFENQMTEKNTPNQALQHNDHDCHGSCSEQHAPRQP
jgi:hypothetical protein